MLTHLGDKGKPFVINRTAHTEVKTQSEYFPCEGKLTFNEQILCFQVSARFGSFLFLR